MQPLGGVRAALEVAEAHGLPCVVSSALESSVGIAAGVALAAALPDLPFACGLATVALFTDDVTSTPLLPVDGALPVVRPEPDRLDAVAADPETEARWRARLAAVRPREPSTAFARVLVDELVRAGVTDAVLAPGSRSAPVALALAAAERDGRLRLHVRIDERTAAFLALGLAKASGRPVPVLTTSGTAAAHLHAAVLEADASGVPLLALTADRPPELRATGANQTIDQPGLYGGAVRWAADVGAPEAGREAAQNRYWRSVVAKALITATGALSGDPGPVHLNLALRDPLLPDDEDVGARGPWRAGRTARRGRRAAAPARRVRAASGPPDVGRRRRRPARARPPPRARRHLPAGR